MDGMDKSEVKRVEDVTLTTTEVPGTTTVTDVAMAENITAAMPQDTEEEEDASEIVNAIIADVTTAAVSTATAATDVTAAGSMETDDTPSTSVTTDVCKAAEPKACTDSSTSDDAATVTDVAATATTDADVKAIMAMDTKVVEPITAPVTAAFCITDPVAADNDIKAPVTDDIKITQPVTADKDITESVTVLADKVTEPVTAGKGIVAPLTADTDIAAPVTMNKDITEPVTARTADKDIAAPVTMNKDITEPVTGGTADKDIAASVTMNKDITEPVTASTADKDIAAPVTMDKDITEPVTAGTADKDIAAPVTMDKDITESVTAGKDIAESVTAEKDIISPVLEDSDIPAPVTAYKDIPAPVTTDKDRTKTVMTDKDSTAPVTVDVDIATSVITDKYIAQPITSDKNNTYPVTTDKDVTTNDTSLDCSNISLPSFLESKSSTGDKFTGNTPECSFEKPQSRSAISSIENSKEVPVMLDTPAEQKTSSLVDEKQRTPTELNMQRPFHNIGVSENSSFTSDVGKYLEGGVQGMSSLQSTPSELPSSSSSKDLILMSLAKDAMSTPDDSLQESRNVDNIEIIQLIEDTTSVSMSMDVDRDASLAEEKEHFGNDLSAAAPVDGEQPAIVGTTTQSSADDSLLSKDSVNKPDKEGEEQPSTTTPRDVPEESCKSEASGKEANIDLEGDVDMVEEKQCKASGDGGKPGTDGEGGEKGDDAEKKDAKSKSAKKRRPGITAETEEEDDENEDHTMPANKLIEYQWPQEKGSEWYMLQEQVTEYLDIVSFKRKYPDLHRRPVEVKEKLHLLESNIAVSEMQCDLGLTALKSDQVHELMARDYPDKFKEYAVVLQARERQKITDHHKGYELPTIDKTKLTMYMKKAVKSAAEYNSMFMKEKREERKAYFDLQTNEVHYPRQQKLVLPKQVTQVGSYPVALIPGQFQDYYKKYTSQELKYFPMNTALYNPPRPLKSLYPDPNQPSEEETEEEKDETKSGSSGKGENDSSSSRAVRGASVGGGQLRVLMQSLEWGTQPSSSSDGSSDSSDSDKGGTTSGDSDLPLKAPTPKSTRKPRTKASKPAWEVASPSLARLSPGKEQPDVPCNICKGGPDKNRAGKAEDLVKCSECNRYAHPSCLDLAVEMVPVIKTYPWQCMECKTCVKCMEPFDEDQMMFCDHCDRGYHTYCVGVRSIPMGRWECPSCHQEEPPKPKRVRRR